MSQLERLSRITLGHGAVGTSLALHLPDELSFEDWEEIGRRLISIEDASAWWIGDWGAKGKWRYGEKYRTIMEATELAYNDVRDLAYVAGNVPEEIRRSDLSFGHHRTVAKLIPAEQAAWLAKAAEEHWTRQQLRDAIAGKTESAGQPAVLEQPFRGLTVDPERLARWNLAAARIGCPLNDWAIAVLDAEAGNA